LEILFLTEGGKGIGFGHISRCSALADGFYQLGHSVKMHLRGEIQNMNNLNNYTCFKTEWFEEEILNKIIEEHEIIVIDSYLASQKILAKIAETTPTPIFLVDSKLNFYPNGIVLFPSVYAKDYANKFNDNVYLLAGPEFLLFGKIFWNLQSFKIREGVDKIAVSLGGLVDEKMVNQVCFAIQEVYNEAEINIFGKLKQNFYSLQKTIIHGFLSKEEYIKKLFENDILIVNGGQSLNEALLVGIPTISVSLADNQVKNAETWEKLGLSTNINPENLNLKNQLIVKLKKYRSIKFRKELSQTENKILNPMGAVNAAKKIIKVFKYKQNER